MTRRASVYQIVLSLALIYRTATYSGVLAGTFTAPVQGSQGQGSGKRMSLYDPVHQRTFSVRRGDITVAFKSFEVCKTCPNGFRFVFETVRSTKSGRARFVIANKMTQVDQIHIVDRKRIAVVGRVQESVGVVTLVETGTGNIIDSFLCFRPAVSPTEDMVAYIKIYPVHFVEGVSSQYLTYDFRLTPTENRSPKIALGNEIDVGIPIFPEGSANLPGDNLAVPEGDRHMPKSEEITWSADGKQVAFVDWSAGQDNLVVVDFASGPRDSRRAMFPLEATQIANTDRCPEYKGRLSLSYSVTTIAFPSAKGEPFRLGFRFGDPACARITTLEVLTR